MAFFFALVFVCLHCILISYAKKESHFPNGNFKSCLISQGFSSSIIYGVDSESYNRLNYQWQLKPPYKQPMAYVLVRSERDVIAVVKCGKQFGIPDMPKGGGHSHEKYSFADSNTIVVDLQKMESTKVSKSKQSASVGAGWLLGPLTFKLWNVGKLFTPLPNCPTVGIVGVATGGGWGYLTRKYGLISDSILAVRIVIANGTLVTANMKQNTDLFWALRGGVASNFGIVTNLVLRTFRAPPHVFCGTLVFNTSEFPEMFDYWQTYSHSYPDSVTMDMVISETTIKINFVDTSGLPTFFETVAKKFSNVETKTSRIFTYPEFIYFLYKNLANEIYTPGTKLESFADSRNMKRESTGPVYETRKSFYVNRKIGGIQIRTLQLLMDRKPPIIRTHFESYGGAISKVLPNATAFNHRGNGQTYYNLKATYKDHFPNTTADAAALLWIDEFYELGSIIFGHQETYQNYVDGTLPNYLQRYFGTNLPQLVEVKRNYDPDNYFKNPQSIPTNL